MRQRVFNVYYTQTCSAKNRKENTVVITPTKKHLAKSKATIAVMYNKELDIVEVATACFNPKHDTDQNSAGFKIAQQRLNSNKWDNLRLHKTHQGYEILSFENSLGIKHPTKISDILLFPCLNDAILCNIAARRQVVSRNTPMHIIIQRNND